MLIFVIFDVMTDLEYRQEAIKWLRSGDDQLARMVHAFIRAYQEEAPAYGLPLTQDDIIARAQASEDDINAGRTTSKDNLKAEMTNW